MSAIELSGVTQAYGPERALSDFSIRIEEGERLVVTGPSGCGKSTLLRLIAGFSAPDSGTVALGGRTVSADGRILVPPEERGIGMVFQDLALWPHLTVRGNLEFGLKAKGVPKADREPKVREVLGLVGLEERIDARPRELSGGQQQRVALARALVLGPRIVLMDEPLSNLDRELALRLRAEIARLQGELGFTLVYVTHNLEEATALGTRVAVLDRGTLRSVGKPE